MAEIGIRELKSRASKVVREVRDKRARYVITYRGRPVAVVVPLEQAGVPADEPSQDAWEELGRLGRELGKKWRVNQSSARLLSQMRR